MLSTSITWERTPHPVRRPGFSCHLFLDNGKLHVENTSMSELEILMSQLQSPHSPKRRSAAKKLRKLGDPVAGPALLEALKHELPDPRTWETQYQMIMALAQCGYPEAGPLIQTLVHEKFDATMVLVAVGDAYVRLRRRSDSDPGPLFEIFAVRNDESLVDGALRAVAMLHMRFEADATTSILEQVMARKSEMLKFWAVAACPGWSGAAVDSFLDQCARSPREDVRNAAVDAKMHKYRKWNPL
jgi:HEAT repeats